MSSILTNASALSALQSLSQTESALKTTENQVSTGLAVSSAADNASYWSIATQLSADSGVVTSANSALAQSQSVLSTASSAIRARERLARPEVPSSRRRRTTAMKTVQVVQY